MYLNIYTKGLLHSIARFKVPTQKPTQKGDEKSSSLSQDSLNLNKLLHGKWHPWLHVLLISKVVKWMGEAEDSYAEVPIQDLDMKWFGAFRGNAENTFGHRYTN